MFFFDKSEGLIPVIVITGPTASGKTALAIELALELDTEIISADSMQIYKGMNISTAKPTKAEMRGVPHHLVDFLSPEESFSVAEFVERAREIIFNLHNKGKIPIVAGGTGLYITSLIDNIKFSEIKPSETLRQKLKEYAQAFGAEQLHQRLAEIDPETANRLYPNNIGRIIRAIEVYEQTGITLSEHIKKSREEPSLYKPFMIGLSFSDRNILYDRINKRVDKMLEQGLVEEAELFFKNRLSPTSAQAIGIKEFFPYFKGEISFEQAVENIKRETRRYAKRQLTWFRSDKRINWFYLDCYENLSDISTEIIKKLHENTNFN